MMLNKQYSINSDKVVWRNIDGEAVILNLDSGYYYSLNEVGTLIWQLLSEKKDTIRIIEAVRKEYSATESKIKKDLDSLIKDLTKEKLIICK
jgi:hypothetical protein